MIRFLLTTTFWVIVTILALGLAIFLSIFRVVA